MTRALALAALMLLASCGTIADTGCGTITMPPPQYTGHKAASRIVWLHAQFIDKFCRGLGVKTNEKGPLTACTGRDPFGWFHVLPDDGKTLMLGCLIVHEDAHLPPNAWPWDHPGGHY